jgi:hypothetical protein
MDRRYMTNDDIDKALDALCDCGAAAMETPATAPTAAPGLPPTKDPSKLPTTAYQFPRDDWEALLDTGGEMVMAELKSYLNPVGSSLGHYARHRDRICQIHLALNRMGALAPGFRQHVHVSNRCATGDIEEMVSRDRQIIDLHWLHESGQRRSIETRNEFQTLLSSDRFDFEQAEEFAKAEWKSETKFEALGLTLARAPELAAIQPQALRAKRRTIETKRFRWLTRLGDVAPTNQRKHFGDWVDVRTAIELIGETTPLSWLCRLVSLMTGTKPIDERGMARKRDTVLKYLPL